MAAIVNRGKVILENWEEKQKELTLSLAAQDDLFDGIRKEKYIHLRSGLARLSLAPGIDERIYVGIIKVMLQKMRRDFFPNFLQRKIAEWKERFLIMPRLTRYFKRKMDENFKNLDGRMQAIGITGFSGYLKEQLDFEREKIAIPISSRFEEDSALDVVLYLEKNRYGDYRLDQMKAVLYTPGGKRQGCLIDGRHELNVNQAVYLLKGGAVLAADLEREEKWVQLDFAIKDEEGNFPLREWRMGGSFSTDHLLKQVSLELNYPGLDQPSVLKIIKNGAQAVFKLESTGIFYLEANPGKRELVFRDEHQKLIPMEVLKKKMLEHISAKNGQSPAIMKLKTKKSLDQSRSLRL